MTIWTLGHSTRTQTQFLNLLLAQGIEALVDIRSFPRSARYPHFARENLAQQLPQSGIRYCWLGKELGGFRKRRDPNSPHTALRSQGFRNYADHTASEDFLQGIAELERLAATNRVAFLCAERLWWRCHRSLVADYLVACRGIEVIHILEDGKTEPHRLHRAARLVQGRLLYDVGDQLELLGRG